MAVCVNNACGELMLKNTDSEDTMTSAILIFVIILLYTLQSFLCKLYTDRYPGKSSLASSIFTVVSGCIIALISLAFAGFRLTVEPMTVFFGVLNAVILYGYNICMAKASQTGSYSILMVFIIAGGIVIPGIVAFFAFGDALSVWQILSMLVIFVSVYLVSYKKDENAAQVSGGKATKLIFFLACFGLALTNGLYGTLLDVQQRVTGVEQKGTMLITTFVSAVLISSVGMLMRERRGFFRAFRQTGSSLFFLVLCSICAGLAINLLVLALPLINVTVLYTFDNSGVMLLSVLASCIFFKEKLSPLNTIGCITMCAGLVGMTLL